ncbi:MAG: DUF1189 domain-containing protein [Lachnospiraceae bacterium]|nr:DUF1189 domain-containing protein [Lachnospiraceae bacterium]
MEEKKMNFWAIPVFAFVPPKYREIIKESAGKIFGALLIWFLVMACINAVKVNSVLGEVTESIRANCPEFRLAGGEFEIGDAYAYDEDGTYVIIDDGIEEVTDDDIKEIALEGDYQSIFMIGKYSMGTFSNGQVETFKYTDLGNFSLSKDSLCNEIMPGLRIVAFVCVVLWGFVSIGLFYFVALIMQLFTKLFANIFKKEFDGVENYRITVLAKFPIHVIVFVIGLFAPLLIGAWINFLLQIVFIALSVFLYAEDDYASDVPVEYIENNTQF